MKYFEAPNWYNGTEPSLFLAGGITGCPDWQANMVNMLENTNWVLLNPRRTNFPITDPTAAEAQIRWEWNHLRMAKAILYWFPCETLCPIVLYELGKWSRSCKPIFVGVHPLYQRRQDVVIQTLLERPEVIVVDTLEDLARQVRVWGECL